MPRPSRAATSTQVADVARKVNANGRSMGVALTSCTVPAAGKPTFELGEDEMELGVGIHGEPGRQRVPLAPAKEIAEMLVEPILADLPFGSGDRVIAFVNGLGGTPLIELYVMYNEVNKILSGHGVTVARSLVGSLHHVAGDGRLVGHAAQGRRRAALPLGRSGQDAGTEVGNLTRWLTT